MYAQRLVTRPRHSCYHITYPSAGNSVIHTFQVNIKHRIIPALLSGAVFLTYVRLVTAPEVVQGVRMYGMVFTPYLSESVVGVSKMNEVIEILIEVPFSRPPKTTLVACPGTSADYITPRHRSDPSYYLIGP